MARSLEPLAVPTGPAVLDLLPRLAAALAGTGPALVPVPAADPRAAAELVRALDGGRPLAAGEDDDADPTAFVVGTSGSTGTPKGTLLPASALLASARATRAFLLGDDPRPAHWLLALPAHHVAGLQVLQRSLVEGTTPTVLDTSTTFTAAEFARAAASTPGPVRLVSLVPTQLVRVLADVDATAALAGFDAVLIGGAAAPPALLDRAAAAGVRTVTTYGMSETCGGCLYDEQPLDGVVVTADPAGRLTLAGPVVARGYRGRPDHPAFDVDGAGRRRFRTDDVGEFTADTGIRVTAGRWRVLGRVDDVLVTGGVKVAPAAVEATLAARPGVAEVVLTGVPDPEWGNLLVAVVVPDTGVPPDPADLRAAARAAHGAPAAPRVTLLVDRLPSRGPGKPDRAAIRTLARDALADAPTRTDAAAHPLVDRRTGP
ncbi:o-succinylbenzoate--CoA ligase [Nakamurella sp.]|uniref:o-succinylbenzoate--CoA ligase n=1 Tax=Nakamurella sp. TaxID=1869182 RepID=UPI003B3AA818